ncbi:MAG TPA: STAS domain-containing protein [Cellvibrio sp.]|nr:STAS domain-containing protein [Cellvibrio sp.]
MRPPVPFIGEELILRDGEHPGETTAYGQIINEVLSTAGETSSWEDSIPAASPTKHRAAAVIKGAANAHSVHKPATDTGPRIDWIPINNGHGLRINISGTIDQALRREWLRLLRETASKDVDQFEFNLTRTPTLNMTGLGMLLLFREQKRSQRQNITLCHCSRQVWELLQWTGMDRYFVIQGATLEEKVKS